MTDVPLYALILFFPLIISGIFGVFLITIVKKLWRSDNPYKHWTYKQSLIWSCVIGVLAGSAFQLLLQSFTEKWIYIDESNRYNLVVFGAICAPMAILYFTSGVLWWAKRTKHDLIYEYFRVRGPTKKKEISDEEYWAEDSDFTVRHNKEEE
mgnify:FL=1